MRIRVHVDRLVLDGLALAGRDRELLASALVAELTTRLQDGGEADGIRSASLANLAAPDIVVRPEGGAGALGAEIGRSVHVGIAPSIGPIPGGSNGARP